MAGYQVLWLTITAGGAADRDRLEWMHEGRLAVLARAERRALECLNADTLEGILSLRRLLLLDYVADLGLCPLP